MTHYLVYWKTYWQDKEESNSIATPAWYTDNKNFREKIWKNDRLWVVVTGGTSAPNEWRLIQSFVVSHVNPKKVNTKWGKYEIIGSRKNNHEFKIDRQPDFTAILWILEFSTRKHIKTLGPKIGQSLQTHGHRTLTKRDVVLLENYAKRLRKA
jgi:hypothetical protein